MYSFTQQVLVEPGRGLTWSLPSSDYRLVRASCIKKAIIPKDESCSPGEVRCQSCSQASLEGLPGGRAFSLPTGRQKGGKEFLPSRGRSTCKGLAASEHGCRAGMGGGRGGRRNRASPGEMLNILSSGGMWILENVHSCSVGKRCEGAQEGGDLEIGEEATEWSDQRWWGLD